MPPLDGMGVIPLAGSPAGTEVGEGTAGTDEAGTAAGLFEIKDSSSDVSSEASSSIPVANYHRFITLSLKYIF